MPLIYHLLILLLFPIPSTLCFGQTKIKDIDGNSYRIVKIDKQTWLAENLKTQRFRNGDSIKQAKTAEEWAQAGRIMQPAWCFYEFNPKNEKKYGKLYNWYAVIDHRGLAPTGWHICSSNEIKLLSNFAGNKAGLKLKSKKGWHFDKSNPTMKNLSHENKGTNIYGFNAKAGGMVDSSGNFSLANYMGYWWTIDENNPDAPLNDYKIGSEKDIEATSKDDKNEAIFYWMEFFSVFLDIYSSEKSYGFSIRCLKN